jgi:CRISPR-associated endoribonuclease Cas6
MKELASDTLHESRSKPFSQSIVYDGPGKYLWNISLLDEVKAESIKSWLNSHPQVVDINYYGAEFEINSIELHSSTTYEDLLAEVLSDLPPKYVSFEFLTPLIFKKSGFKNPWPYPEGRLMVQSALSRWNEFSDAAKFDDPQILEEAALHITPQSFSMHSRNVAMDSSNFVGSIGNACFSVIKSELRHIVHLSGRYAEYCGLGAKTAMGLGAVRFHPGIRSKTKNVEIC